MVEVGDVGMKLAGRDAGKICAVVELVDKNYVIIDGATRKRKCNLSHLEFLNRKIKIKKNASSDDVRKALRDAGFEIIDAEKGKSREKRERQAKIRKSSIKEKPLENIKKKKS